MIVTRRICSLCGRPFAILIPPGDQEAERDKLCSGVARHYRRLRPTPRRGISQALITWSYHVP
jgi:hypothetical protein